MNLLELIPPTGASLLYLCKVADLFPVECRERLDQLEAQGKVYRINNGKTIIWYITASEEVMLAAIRKREGIAPTNPKRDVQDVVEQCEQIARVAPGSILSTSRTIPVVRARDAAATILHAQGKSYPEIAEALGYCSHTSVMAAVKRHLKRRGEVANRA